MPIKQGKNFFEVKKIGSKMPGLHVQRFHCMNGTESNEIFANRITCKKAL